MYPGSVTKSLMASTSTIYKYCVLLFVSLSQCVSMCLCIEELNKYGQATTVSYATWHQFHLNEHLIAFKWHNQMKSCEQQKKNDFHQKPLDSVLSSAIFIVPRAVCRIAVQLVVCVVIELARQRHLTNGTQFRNGKNLEFNLTMLVVGISGHIYILIQNIQCYSKCHCHGDNKICLINWPMLPHSTHAYCHGA